MLLHKVGKEFDAIAHLLIGPALPHLDVDERDEVLVGLLGHTLEVLKLVANSRAGAHKVVTAHLDSVFARVLDVVEIAARGIGGTFSGFDVDKFDFLVGCRGSPVDVLLVVAHIDAVENEFFFHLCIVKVDDVARSGRPGVESGQ